MKKILLVLATGLFALGCNNKMQTGEAPKNTDLIQQNIKGKVQRVEETPYKVDSTGKIGEMDSCCVGTTDYDEKGYTSKYSAKDSKGALTEEQNFTRFENGKFKGGITTNKGKKTSSIDIQIDKEGKYSGAQTYDSTGKMDSYFTDLTEDEYGSVTGWKQYKIDSTLKGSWSGVYEKNIWVSSTTTDSTGKVNGTYKSKLDDKGNVIEFTSMEVKKDSTTNKVTTYKYDSFDDQGNWTQRTEYEKGKPVKIVKRNIVYYKVD